MLQVSPNHVMLWHMPKPNDQLEPLELTPWRVLVIAAHPGDIEYVASAAVAKWTKDGADVVYLIATRGELSIPGIEPEDAALIRSAEQSAAAAAVGVDVVDFLDVDDGTVEPTVALRRAIMRDIRHFRPDVVMIMNHRELEPDGTMNDPDHRAVGTAALDAVIAAANQWAFRDVGEPHLVDLVLVAASPQATHAIDVTGFEHAALEAFSAHEQHLAAVSSHPMAGPSWLSLALKGNSGHIPGSSAVITVEQIQYGQGRPCHSSIVKESATKDDRVRVMKLPGKKRTKNPKHKLASGPVEERNASPKKAARKAKSRPAKTVKAPVVETGTMRLKARLEQSGRLTGIEIPESVMERLGGGKRPSVTVSLNDTAFDTTIGTNGGRRFIAINAERRKAASIEVNDTFFVTLSVRPD